MLRGKIIIIISLLVIITNLCVCVFFFHGYSTLVMYVEKNGASDYPEIGPVGESVKADGAYSASPKRG